MPLSAPHPCATPGCPELVRGRPRCERHELGHQVADRQRRGTAAERGYGARWQRERAAFLSDPKNATCRPCSKKTPPLTTAADVVDHIVDHKGDEELMWSWSNWQPSCERCHNSRTDAGDFGRSA